MQIRSPRGNFFHWLIIAIAGHTPVNQLNFTDKEIYLVL